MLSATKVKPLNRIIPDPAVEDPTAIKAVKATKAAMLVKGSDRIVTTIAT